MQFEDMVPASEFCVHHNIELSFIDSLREYGLVETILIEEKVYLPVSQLGHLEKIVRLHFDLEINLEGIETIAHLLEKVNQLQDQVTKLTNRLKAYE
jgi:chaperone modulatory protein CbpM